MRPMSKVQVYTKGWCPYCFAAKSLLEGKKVTFEEIDASDPDVRMDMIQRAHGRRTVPQIFIGDRHIGGYDELAALERRGELDTYLRTE